MKNFDWTQFTRKIAVQAPINVLYDAWAVPKQIERWFLSDAVFYSDAGHKIEKSERISAGCRYDWRWYLYDLTESGMINEANGKDHIQFTFAGDCIVDINLEALENLTVVSLTQKEIPVNEDAKLNVRLGCDTGWSFYLVNLKSIYEGGIDLRNKNPKLKSMLNS